MDVHRDEDEDEDEDEDDEGGGEGGPKQKGRSRRELPARVRLLPKAVGPRITAHHPAASYPAVSSSHRPTSLNSPTPSFATRR